MPNKVVVTVTNDLTQDQRMHRVCTSLVQAGYQVTFVGRSRKNALPLLDLIFNQKRLPCWFDSGVLFYLEYNLRLFFYLMFHKYDLLYSVDLDTIGAGGAASFLKRKKHVHDAHEFFTEVPELKNKTIKKWIWDKLGFMFLGGCNLRFTVNKELSAALGSRYNQPFEVLRSVPLMGNTKRAVFNRRLADRKIILYQGVLNEGRGLEQAITAVSEMKEDVHLHIVGEGDLSKELRDLKQRIDFEDKVHFLGWKLPDQLKEITQEAWLGLNLLDGDSLNYKYSLANKFFDYMHAGIPSLNMDFPVYRRYCVAFNVGLCIPSLTVDSIKETISSLINDPEKYDALRVASLEARSPNSWEKEEVKLISSISKILDI